MGYSHGKTWTNEQVIKEIKDVMKSLNINRMPSRNEVERTTKDASLSNKISRSGGFYHWAELIGIPIKESETKTAIAYEEKAKQQIFDLLGLESQLTPVCFPYDILVENLTKVDVKISNGFDGKKGFFFSFNLEYRFPKCDFYILYCVNERRNKTLIVPAHVMSGKNQISVGINSIYDKYIDRWDLIETHLKAMSVLAI
jgi:hypothetical protein